MTRRRVAIFGALICAAVFLVPLAIIASSWPVDWERIAQFVLIGLVVYVLNWRQR